MSLRYWAVIPAAGAGTRMGAEVPKQYLKIRGKYILEYVLERFCLHPDIEGTVVATAKDDQYWYGMTISSHAKVMRTAGGKERCHSVLNGLEYLQDRAHDDDWVLVHDAARPCLRREDMDHLMSELSGHPVGGILALPVRDTMKRAGEGNEIIETVERQRLWHALTPQMFRFGSLKKALREALVNNRLVTDEAQAMELAGHRPRLVQGHPDNIKVTQQLDLSLAELYLSKLESGK